MEKYKIIHQFIDSNYEVMLQYKFYIKNFDDATISDISVDINKLFNYNSNGGPGSIKGIKNFLNNTWNYGWSRETLGLKDTNKSYSTYLTDKIEQFTNLSHYSNLQTQDNKFRQNNTKFIKNIITSDNKTVSINSFVALRKNTETLDSYFNTAIFTKLIYDFHLIHLKLEQIIVKSLEQNLGYINSMIDINSQISSLKSIKKDYNNFRNNQRYINFLFYEQTPGVGKVIIYQFDIVAYYIENVNNNYFNYSDNKYKSLEILNGEIERLERLLSLKVIYNKTYGRMNADKSDLKTLIEKANEWINSMKIVTTNSSISSSSTYSTLYNYTNLSINDEDNDRHVLNELNYLFYNKTYWTKIDINNDSIREIKRLIIEINKIIVNNGKWDNYNIKETSAAFKVFYTILIIILNLQQQKKPNFLRRILALLRK